MRLTSLLSAFMLSLLVAAAPAEAKRMGSGGNLGDQKSSFSRQSSPPPASTPAPARNADNAATRPAGAQSGASRWLGPLAGLAAGGLLAAMLFGDGFEGIQFMDILLIALLAFGAFYLFRMMRRGSSGPMAQPAPAGAGNAAPYARQSPEPAAPAPVMPQAPSSTPVAGSLAAELGGMGRPALPPLPAWFDENRFLEAARMHFINLQAAWDANKLEEIREYVTPELFEQLAAQRAEIGQSPNETRVLEIDTRLIDFEDLGDEVRASVLNQARISENGAPAEDVREVWHIRRSNRDPQANWYISGIQQMEAALN